MTHCILIEFEVDSEMDADTLVNLLTELIHEGDSGDALDRLMDDVQSVMYKI